jgi:hypothetical protein
MKSRNDTGTTTETPEQLIEHISRLMAEAEAMIAGPHTEQNGGKLASIKERSASKPPANNSRTFTDARATRSPTLTAGPERALSPGRNIPTRRSGHTPISRSPLRSAWVCCSAP